MPNPVTIEIAIIHIRRAGEEPVWHEAGRFRSVREARRLLAWAVYDHVSYLSRAMYEIRLRRADGSIKPLSESQQDHAVRRAKRWQRSNTIGARLARGEAVAV